MSQQFTSDRPSIDEIMALRKPRTETVVVILDDDLFDRLEGAKTALRHAELEDLRNPDAEPSAPALQEAVDELLDEAERVAVEFTFQALPRKLYRKLVDLHPSKDKTKRWDETWFDPALIAASCVQPELTSIPRAEFLERLAAATKAGEIRPFVEKAKAIYDEWSATQTSLLFGAAYLANEGPSNVPKSVRRTAETTGTA